MDCSSFEIMRGGIPLFPRNARPHSLASLVRLCVLAWLTPPMALANSDEILFRVSDGPAVDAQMWTDENRSLVSWTSSPL
jgi:hypothetical protein